ncbi:nitrous oxide reductase accessory protein NosL [Thauera aromatica]
MGPTAASFAREADAQAFATEHGGSVLRFDEVTPTTSSSTAAPSTTNPCNPLNNRGPGCMQTEANRPNLLEGEGRLRALQFGAAVAAAAMGMFLLHGEHQPMPTSTTVNYDLSWIVHHRPSVMQSKEAHCLCTQPSNDCNINDVSFWKIPN